MAATAYAFYNSAKHKLATGAINLSADNFRFALYKTAATNPADLATLTAQSQISNECTGGAYTQYGELLTSVTWGTGTSAGQQKFDVGDLVITASGSAISGVLFGVIVKSSSASDGALLCYSQLSTAAFDVTSGNTLTIQQPAAGVFTLA